VYSDFSIAVGGKSVVTAHVNGKHHKDVVEACSSRSVTSFFRPQVPECDSIFVNYFSSNIKIEYKMCVVCDSGMGVAYVLEASLEKLASLLTIDY